VLRFWKRVPALGRRNRAPDTACSGARTWNWCSKSSGLLYEQRFTIEGARNIWTIALGRK